MKHEKSILELQEGHTVAAQRATRYTGGADGGRADSYAWLRVFLLQRKFITHTQKMTIHFSDVLTPTFVTLTSVKRR